jgi:hypothetical protein
MANVMPPATESIMSTLPREKAGVGSAVSNTVRQVAGALGIAVLGSILSGVYRSHIESTTAALPASARNAANESISGAHGVADRIGAASGSLISGADHAFVTAMHTTAVVAAVVALIGVIVSLGWIPGKRDVNRPAAIPKTANADAPAAAGDAELARVS